MKRTALTRTANPSLAVRVKRCKNCRGTFFPASSMQCYCRTPVCAQAAYEAVKAKREAAEAREHREKKADSKRLAHWHALTQRAVNALVQARDKGRPCISCGATSAAQWDAGHYLSRGANPALRYELANLALQCVACNRFKSGNQALFRAGLLVRIGVAEVARLEGPHPLAKHTRESLDGIRKWASAEKRRIESEAA